MPSAKPRYTTIKSGRRRLLVPNSAFITREFMILDDPPDNGSVSPRGGSADLAPLQQQPAAHAMPLPPMHHQPVPHDWVQRSLEAQPFHRDPSQQPGHMSAASYQSEAADGNGGCAGDFPRAGCRPGPAQFVPPRRLCSLSVTYADQHTVFARRVPPEWNVEEQHAGQSAWQRREHTAARHERLSGGDDSYRADAKQAGGPAESPEQNGNGHEREPAIRGYRAASGDRYKGRSPSSRTRHESGYGPGHGGANGSETFYHHSHPQHYTMTQGGVGRGGQIWDGRGYVWPDQHTGGFQSGPISHGPW